MKKFLGYFLLLVIAYVMITRFVEYDVAPAPVAKPQVACNDQDPGLPSCTSLAAINQSYLQNIKPIFEQKCASCHGQVARQPLYAKLPPSSWLVEEHIEDAKSDLEISNDFPFGGLGSQDHLLEEIGEVVEDGSMPLLSYKLLHWKAGLTGEEKQKIGDWVKQSRDLLKQ